MYHPHGALPGLILLQLKVAKAETSRRSPGSPRISTMISAPPTVLIVRRVWIVASIIAVSA